MKVTVLARLVPRHRPEERNAAHAEVAPERHLPAGVGATGRRGSHPLRPVALELPLERREADPEIGRGEGAVPSRALDGGEDD